MKTTLIIMCAICFLMLVGLGSLEAQTVSRSIGVLPASKTITITYDVRVKNPVGNGVSYVATQGSVAGSNFSTLQTNDPDTPAVDDSTATTVVSPPHIASFDPTTGPVGTPVTIDGSHFTGATAVAFNGTDAGGFTVVPPGLQITTVVPDGATTGKISVTGPNGTTLSIDDFSFVLPIQLSSFAAYEVPGQGVQLRWTTVSEVNNFGFYVHRRSFAQMAFGELPNSFNPGHGTTNSPQQYEFRDTSAIAGQWFYRLKQVDLDGSQHLTDQIQVSILTSVAGEIAPKEFSLLQNYPNPFNPSTEIRFSVAQSGRAMLRIFNALGQRVATLFDDVAEAGQYYKVRFDGGNVSSGVYFYSLQSTGQRSLKKLILLK